MDQEINIFLDDQADEPGLNYRATPEGYTPVKNVQGFKALIEKCVKENITIKAISFDNDLGEETEGYDLLKWIETVHPEILESDIILKVHSMNPVNKEKIHNEIQKLKNKDYVKQLIEAKSRPDPWATIPMK